MGLIITFKDVDDIHKLYLTHDHQLENKRVKIEDTLHIACPRCSLGVDGLQALTTI